MSAPTSVFPGLPVTYTDRKGHGKQRGAIVIGTPATLNAPEVPDADAAVLAKYGASVPHTKHAPLAEDEVLLKVFAPTCTYNKRAIFDAELGTFRSVSAPAAMFDAADDEAGDEDSDLLTS